MTPHTFSDYAALWREQIDPKELAELQAMATKIKRTAGRRWLLDRVLALVAAGLVCFAILRYPAPPLINLGLALLLLGPVWHVWRRHQITRASRAIAIDDPRVFFEAAIENVRAEINLSTLSTAFGIPTFIACLLLAGAADGFDHIYMNFRDLFAIASVKLTSFAAIFVLILSYFIRDNIRLREQLRRLEAMRREWDERDPGEEP
ncbi:MAG TPA: hypothetical protein VK614_12500 [Allosphingosinicella sp.]|nr:hypothetical protein [Allosphingosinicella sp.]